MIIMAMVTTTMIKMDGGASDSLQTLFCFGYLFLPIFLQIFLKNKPNPKSEQKVWKTNTFWLKKNVYLLPYVYVTVH